MFCAHTVEQADSMTTVCFSTISVSGNSFASSTCGCGLFTQLCEFYNLHYRGHQRDDCWRDRSAHNAAMAGSVQPQVLCTGRSWTALCLHHHQQHQNRTFLPRKGTVHWRHFTVGQQASLALWQPRPERHSDNGRAHSVPRPQARAVLLQRCVQVGS